MELKKCKKTLIVKLRHLGDVLLTSPVFSILKATYPEMQIDALIYKEASSVLEGHPAISFIHCYDREWKKESFLKRMQEEMALYMRIRKEKYDLVINLTEGDRGALVALLSGASIRVGNDPGREGFFGKRKIYTHIIKHCGAPRHSVEKNIDGLRVLDIYPSEDERELTFVIPSNVRQNVHARLLEKGFIEGFILFHPSSRWGYKCWETKKSRRLVEMLLEKNQRVVLTSGPSAQEIAGTRAIVDGLVDRSLLNLAGKTSIKELGALIDMSKAIFCFDSLPLHMASALKKKCVVAFGPTQDKTWGPWNNPLAVVVKKGYTCQPCCLDGCAGCKKSDCLETLSVEEILLHLL